MWIAELRALGGAWDREPAVPNAVATRGLPYVLLGVEVGPLSEEQRLKESIAALLDGMAPWQGDRRLVNNLAPEEAADAVAIYGPERYERLAACQEDVRPDQHVPHQPQRGAGRLIRNGRRWHLHTGPALLE